MKSFKVPGADFYLRFHELSGLGVPLVFLHGLGCAASCDFPRVATDASLRPRRSLLLDFAGSGYSDKPDDFSYSLQSHADCVIAWLESLGVPQVNLIGHSMGGSIAIMVAAQRPDLIQRLIVAEPNLDAGGGVFSRSVTEYTEEEYLRSGHARLIDVAVRGNNHIWAGCMGIASPRAIHRQAVGLVEGEAVSWREQLYQLSMPATVLFGEFSLPEPDVAVLPQHGIHTAIVPQAGHSMMWENPTGVAAAINAALNAEVL